jgi:D-alanyl-D-alanine dipeptidase
MAAAALAVADEDRKFIEASEAASIVNVAANAATNAASPIAEVAAAAAIATATSVAAEIQQKLQVTAHLKLHAEALEQSRRVAAPAKASVATGKIIVLLHPHPPPLHFYTLTRPHKQMILMVCLNDDP